MARLIYLPEAKEEIKQAAKYYELRRNGLGRKFLSSVEAAVKNIALYPRQYRIFRGQFRRCLLIGFPYGVVYIATKTCCRHASQKKTRILAQAHSINLLHSTLDVFNVRLN